MQETPQRGQSAVLAYLLWLIGIAACVIALLQFQAAVNALGAALGANRYALRLWNQVSLLVGGLAAFIYAMFLQGYYQGAARRGRLWPRFLKSIAAPIAIALLSLAAVEIVLRTM